MSMVKRVLGAFAVFLALAMLLFVPLAGATTTYTTTLALPLTAVPLTDLT